MEDHHGSASCARSEEPPARRYLAVRRCDGLLSAPAIFFDKHDLFRFMGGEAAAQQAEYQEFPRVVDAMQYLYNPSSSSSSSSSSISSSSNHQHPGQGHSHAQAQSTAPDASSSSSSSLKRSTATAASSASKRPKTGGSSSTHVAAISQQQRQQQPQQPQQPQQQQDAAAREEQEWRSMFLQLEARARQGKDVEYVSYLEHPALSVWLRQQLNLYRAIKNGKDISSSTTVNPVQLSQRFLKLQQVGYHLDTHKRNPSFEEKAREWYDYYQAHGSDPTAENPLNKWVNRVRTWYVKHQNGEPTRMKPEHIELLKSLGFRFTTDRGSKLMGKSRPTWEQRFQQLLDYKQEHGNCFVPVKYGGTGGLGAWVVMQRKWYKDYMNNAGNSNNKQRRTFLNPEKIEKLRNAGFCFSMVTDTTETPWHERFEQLVQYQQAHNNTTNVPNKVPGLGPWVAEQKRLLKEGKLSEFHRMQLASIGMVPHAHSSTTTRTPKPKPPPPPTKPAPWYETYYRLKEYQQLHGTTCVEKSQSPQLYAWTCRQRMEYQKKKQNGSFTLTDGQVAILNDLNFDWDGPTE